MNGWIASPNSINRTQAYGRSTLNTCMKMIATATEIIDQATSIRYDDNQNGKRVAPDMSY